MTETVAANPVLSIRNLTTTIHSDGLTFDVVRGLSLDIYPNEIVCLVGESGCGKTVAALSVMRLLPEAAQITGGSIRFKGKELVSASERDIRSIRAEEISMIFQDPLTSLDPSFTVGSILKELIKVHRGGDDQSATELALATLAEVEIPDAKSRMDAYPHQLSGGMRQRVMIAMALALDPDLLIADEPTTALDVTVQAQILDRLVEEQRQRQMAMLLITHDLAVVASVAHRVAVMYSGEIVEQAPVDQLFADPRHPYTQGLIHALPHVSARKEPLYSIPGRVPRPSSLLPVAISPPLSFRHRTMLERSPSAGIGRRLVASVLQPATLCVPVTVGPLPIEIEVQAGTKLRGHEWLVLGPPVIMVHDEDGDLDAWGPALQMSADAGFHVIAVDLRGHGLSDGDADSNSLESDVATLVRQVNRVWGKCGLVLAGRACRGALKIGSDEAPAQVLITPDLSDINEATVHSSQPAIRMVIVGTLDPVARSESKRVFDALPGQKVMASVGDAARGERLLEGRAHLIEDICSFFRMYLSPLHPSPREAAPRAGPQPPIVEG